MLKKSKKFQKPSEEFKLAIRHASTSIIDCELCGRVHYSPNSDLDFDKEEMAYFINKGKENPDKYIGHFSGSVEWGAIDGKQAVIDCICNKLSKYEDFIWSHRNLIVNYLGMRTKEDLKTAIQEKGLADKVKKLIK